MSSASTCEERSLAVSPRSVGRHFTLSMQRLASGVAFADQLCNVPPLVAASAVMSRTSLLSYLEP